jgi:hypothetical protein
MGYSGAGGKLIHKKTRSKKSRDTVPLTRFFVGHILPTRIGISLRRRDCWIAFCKLPVHSHCSHVSSLLPAGDCDKDCVRHSLAREAGGSASCRPASHSALPEQLRKSAKVNNLFYCLNCVFFVSVRSMALLSLSRKLTILYSSCNAGVILNSL